MRIFADAEGKTNLDLKAVDGNLLIILNLHSMLIVKKAIGQVY